MARPEAQSAGRISTRQPWLDVGPRGCSRGGERPALLWGPGVHTGTWGPTSPSAAAPLQEPISRNAGGPGQSSPGCSSASQFIHLGRIQSCACAEQGRGHMGSRPWWALWALSSALLPAGSGGAGPGGFWACPQAGGVSRGLTRLMTFALRLLAERTNLLGAWALKMWAQGSGSLWVSRRPKAWEVLLDASSGPGGAGTRRRWPRHPVSLRASLPAL